MKTQTQEPMPPKVAEPRVSIAARPNLFEELVKEVDRYQDRRLRLDLSEMDLDDLDVADLD